MTKNQFTGTATEPHRTGTGNYVNLIMTSTIEHVVSLALISRRAYSTGKYFSVPMRFQSGSVKLAPLCFFTTFCDI